MYGVPVFTTNRKHNHPSGPSRQPLLVGLVVQTTVSVLTIAFSDTRWTSFTIIKVVRIKMVSMARAADPERTAGGIL